MSENEGQIEGNAGEVVENTPEPVENQAEVAPNEGEIEGKQAPAQPAYTPNFKFKVLDSEHEIDPEFRALIKDAETEKKIKGLFEKAYGLDHYKQKHTKLSQDFSKIKTEYDNFQAGIRQVEEYINNKDFKSFMNTLKIPKELVYQYVLDELKYKDLPPEQKKLYDDKEAAAYQAKVAQTESQRVKEQYETMLQQVREAELSTILSTPEINEKAAIFDSRAGKQGAFKEAIANHGYALFVQTGKDFSAKEVTDNFLKLYGAGIAPAQQGGAGNSLNAASKPADRKPHIPNVTGSGQSPTKKIPKSIEDLKAIAKAMSEE